MKSIVLPTLLALAFSGPIRSEPVPAPSHPDLQGHPRLLARASEKPRILEKIRTQAWAREGFEAMRSNVDVYADRHVKDPGWILGRMPMHWERHYTNFPSYGGEPVMWHGLKKSAYKGYFMDTGKRSGQAPVPTVWVAESVGDLYAKTGGAIRLPALEAVKAYVTEDEMDVEDSERPGKTERLPPGIAVFGLGRSFAELAMKSATLYFLTDDEKYARLASDILMTWTLGIYFQNGFNDPPEGPETVNCFLGGQDLHDRVFKAYGPVYDFCHGYLARNQGRYLSGDFYPEPRFVDKKTLSEAMAGKTLGSVVDGAFGKFIERGILSRAFTANKESPNNHVVWSSEIMWLALAMDDRPRREALMEGFLFSDTNCRPVRGPFETKGNPCWVGALSWNTIFSVLLTPEGMVPETMGYHQPPIRSAAISSVVLDRCGYDPYRRFPEFFRATYAQFRYVFPNGVLPGYGDVMSTVKPDGYTLDLARCGAIRAGVADAEKLGPYLGAMVARGEYERKGNDAMALLNFEGDIPPSTATGGLPRTDDLAYCGLVLQRNGTDPEDGLMVHVNGGQYTHRHHGGMAFEVYGKGWVMGPHCGTKYPYGSKIMRENYEPTGSKNVVVPNDLDGDPVVTSLAMEPQPRAKALSASYSFTETAADYGSEKGQRRTVALIRTSPRTGYYLDIFRSANDVKNEYRYYNLGQSVTVSTPDGKALSLREDTNASLGAKGDSYLRDVRRCDGVSSSIQAGFAMRDFSKNRDLTMRLHMLGGSDTTYFTVMAPASTASGLPYGDTKLTHSRPGLIARRDGEAWMHPFVGLLEPAVKGEEKVRLMEPLPCQGSPGLVAVRVVNREDPLGEQVIFSGPDEASRASGDGVSFTGRFGLIHRGPSGPRALYLGRGTALTAGAWSLRSLAGSPISACLEHDAGNLVAGGSGPFELMFTRRQTGANRPKAIYLAFEDGTREAATSVAFQSLADGSVKCSGSFKGSGNRGRIEVE